MRVWDDDGVELDAAFDVVVDGGLLGVVLESAGGKVPGATFSRNHDYVPALRLLLTRLRDRRAVLVAALVASSRVSGLDQARRSLLAEPVVLLDVADVEVLRREITRAQGRVGQAPGATKEGNNRKRLLLRLRVPGYELSDVERLARDLAQPATTVQGVVDSRELPDAVEVLRDLIGSRIPTFTGRLNTVVAVDGDEVVVRTERSPSGQSVKISDVQAGIDLLALRRTVRVAVDELGHRSSFVAAVLASLPGAGFVGDPARVVLDTPTANEVTGNSHYGELDAVTQVKVRTEQRKLRTLLARGRKMAGCALCGEEYPLEFLVAAHIKKRAACTDEERRNLDHIAMLACSFGCDKLYEDGWITVADDGTIQSSPRGHILGPTIMTRLDQLHGLRCAVYSPHTETYFVWHRATIFRRK